MARWFPRISFHMLGLNLTWEQSQWFAAKKKNNLDVFNRMICGKGKRRYIMCLYLKLIWIYTDDWRINGNTIITYLSFPFPLSLYVRERGTITTTVLQW